MNNGTFDTAVYNRLTRKWVREGKTLTESAANRRLTVRQNQSPGAQFKVVKRRG